MAFDPENPTQLAELTAELQLPAYPDVPTVQKLKLLNDPALNDGTGGRTPGGEDVSRPFSVLAMLDALDPTDFDAQQTATGAPNYVHTLVELGAYEDIEPYRAKFESLFAGNSATVTALAAQRRLLSRAEALWGVDSSITRAHIASAIGNT